MAAKGIVSVVASTLSSLGRQGTRAVAGMVVIAAAVPPIGRALKPHVAVAVFLLLCISFLRMDVTSVKAYVRRPTLVLVSTAWTSIAVPVLVGLGCLASGLDKRAPELFLALLLQAIASPMMASPALATLMGLDATLVLVSLIASTALIPVTAPLFASLFVGPALSISASVFAAKLLALVAGSATVGLVARRVVGPNTIEQHQEELNGLNILALFIFMAAIMDGVGARLLASPLTTLVIALVAAVVFLAIFIVTTLLFRAAGRARALALGLMVSQRNMGLMLAGTGGALPDLTWLYFALSQLPIYLSPHLLRPLARRVLEIPESPARPARSINSNDRGF